jgi:hypothetical protein
VDANSFSAALAGLLGRCGDAPHSQTKSDQPSQHAQEPALIQRVHEAAHILRQEEKPPPDKQPDQEHKQGQDKPAEQEKPPTRGGDPRSTEKQKDESWTDYLDRRRDTTPGKKDDESWTDYLDRRSSTQGNADDQSGRKRNLSDEQKGKDHSHGL